MTSTKAQLIDLLEQEPGRFEPVTAFRVAQQSGGDTQITAPVGGSISKLAVDNVEKKKSGISIRSTFATLIGPTGSLPPSFSELAVHEARNRSTPFSAFIDMFNSRLATLFADACEKYRLARKLRWHDVSESTFIKSLLSFTGFNTVSLVKTSSVDHNVLLYYSGYFSARIKNGVNLAALLSDFSGLPVEIEQFRGRWFKISAAEQSKLGVSNNVLGVDSVVGSSFFDRSSSFRVVIGPISYNDYISLTPDNCRIKNIYEITCLYVDDILNFDFQIVLRREDIPYSQLKITSTRLGWNSWARVEPAKEDSKDAIIVPLPNWMVER